MLVVADVVALVELPERPGTAEQINDTSKKGWKVALPALDAKRLTRHFFREGAAGRAGAGAGRLIVSTTAVDGLLRASLTGMN